MKVKKSQNRHNTAKCLDYVRAGSNLCTSLFTMNGSI